MGRAGENINAGKRKQLLDQCGHVDHVRLDGTGNGDVGADQSEKYTRRRRPPTLGLWLSDWSAPYCSGKVSSNKLIPCLTGGDGPPGGGRGGGKGGGRVSAQLGTLKTMRKRNTKKTEVTAERKWNTKNTKKRNTKKRKRKTKMKVEDESKDEEDNERRRGRRTRIETNENE